jgi:CheY-like chemotaxis protein
MRILLVDDYPDALEVGRLYLSTCGFDVETAGDGQAALDFFQSSRGDKRPDLVILDLELPKLGGLDVARRLRAAPETATLPLVAVTGHSDPERLAEARHAGFDIVLTKPCNPITLREEIQRLLDGSAQS